MDVTWESGTMEGGGGPIGACVVSDVSSTTTAGRNPSVKLTTVGTNGLTIVKKI
jgi:hypothetical protein